MSEQLLKENARLVVELGEAEENANQHDERAAKAEAALERCAEVMETAERTLADPMASVTAVRMVLDHTAKLARAVLGEVDDG